MVGHIPPNRRGRVFSILGQGVGVTYGGVSMEAVVLSIIPGTVGSLTSGFVYGFDARLPLFILSAALAKTNVRVRAFLFVQASFQ